MNTKSKNSFNQLFNKDSEKAWQIFLDDYNNLLLSVINKMVKDHDERMELYAYALEKLRANNFKKIFTYFDKPKPYDFTVWLTIITKNCCSDWFRKEKGRKRLLKCIKNLPELDQWIFRYVYWQKYSYEISYELLKANNRFNGSFIDFCHRLDHINEILERQTKWNLYETWFSVISHLPLEKVENEPYTGEAPQRNPSDYYVQEEQIISSDRTHILNEILNQIPAEEQLIIKLHFYRGLTLDQIARLMKLNNLWKVQRKLQKALKSLKKKLKKRGLDLSDF